MLRWKIEKGTQGGATFYQRDSSVLTWTESFSLSNTTDMLNADGDNIVINSGAISKTIAYSSVDLIDGVLPSGTFAGFWLQVQSILPKIADTAYVDAKSEETYRRLYDAFIGATAPEGLDTIVELAAFKVDKSSIIDDINVTTAETGGNKNIYSVSAVQGLKTWVNSTFEPVLLAQRKTNWDSAFSWGNHSSVGYLLATTAASTYATISQWDGHDTSITNLGIQAQAFSDSFDAHVLAGNTSAHSVSNITGLSTTLSDKANLVGGLLVEDEMPSWLTTEVKGRVFTNPDYFAKKVVSSENKYLVQDMTSGVNIAYGYDTLEGWRIGVGNASYKTLIYSNGFQIHDTTQPFFTLSASSTRNTITSFKTFDIVIADSNDVNFLLGVGSKFKINNNDIYGEFAAINHTHSIANITGLQTALDGKLNLSGGTMSGALNIVQANPYLTGDKLYVFGRTLLDGDLEVSGNLIVGGDYGIPNANGATTGLLSNTDWNTFNGKQAALVSGTNIKTINGSSILGSGNLSVSSQWTTSGSDIYYTGGSVMIGTSTPTIIDSRYKLIAGELSYINFLNSAGYGYLGNARTATSAFPNAFGLISQAQDIIIGNEAGQQFMKILNSNGNVGIGSGNPSERLHVNGNIYFDRVRIQTSYDFWNGVPGPIPVYYFNVVQYVPSTNNILIQIIDSNGNNVAIKTI